MTYEVAVKTKAKVSYLKANMGVRYWEDGRIGGEADNNDVPQMPLSADGYWNIVINLSTGEILDWPKGTTAETHYKVCDDGVYSLLDHTMETIVTKDGYVPNMLSPDGGGYGDYVIMKIDETGKIDGWKVDLEYFEDDE